ncbi:MAG: hypothetical protein LDLANPLL_02222 [Turneriella sp.]|nr:hypothetical protein [Turneriella sp.]
MSDSPLPLALGYITGATHPMYHLLVSIGLLGLIASFHGILLVAGRTTMELGRARYIHHRFALLHPTRQTPMAALLLNMVLGVLILLSGKTSEMITLAALGALSIYIFALVALFVLRKKSASLDRPYRTPLYPFTPALALVIAVIAFFAMLYFNLLLGLIYFGILLLGSIYFRYTTMRVKKTDVHGK